MHTEKGKQCYDISRGDFVFQYETEVRVGSLLHTHWFLSQLNDIDHEQNCFWFEILRSNW